ncbi:hypothetical protein PLESTB_000007700 [Pleodorina starrii]|uniref:Uncharacterized protein n=1 Tax=Pleodorina starrii TaxID=330485 RepID=A0A9W6B9C6_9CHLO|nr:hypothetical protein PLESTM_000839500 [Pleodorina starrii]GLC47618.1 hypothetical protein PLESTB_000007700 [Pleodorina starrii]GLC75626.1 hypothetical protein PLESTF_001666700 [Pleodorina starrii]
MPQLLSRVGKALGNILRAPGSNDSSGRNRSSGDSDAGLDGSKRGRASAAGASPASKPSLRQNCGGQTESHESLGSSTSQSTSQLDVAPGATVADVSGRAAAGRSSAGGDAAAATGALAAPVATVAQANGAISDASSLASCSSPPAAPQFFRASRASLSDATASAAGEALRQASVTTCKHFTRENYNNYVRWVRASRGAMKIAGKIRSRVEPTARNPNPTLLLRCEHWLEVTDEQHRYGSNLRVYFDYWVAEMEAAELTPPASPALMSPSPSYGHLVALATAQQQQQQQNMQQQLAGAIESSAMGEHASSSAAGLGSLTPDYRLQTRSQQQLVLQQPIAASVVAAQSPYPGQTKPLPPLPPHQNQQELLSDAAPGPQQAAAGTCSTACQGQAAAGHSPGPGPSRFSNDACTAPRTVVGSPLEACGHIQEDKQPPQPQPPPQQQQQRNGQQHPHRVHHHYHHHHQNHHHNYHYDHHSHQHHPMTALARGGREQGGEGQRPPTGDIVLVSQSSRPLDDAQLLPAEQEQQEGDTAAVRAQQQDGQRRNSQQQQQQQQQRQHYRRHHDLDLYEREGSVHRDTDDGGGGSADGLPACMSVGRSHDGGDNDEGPLSRAAPLSPSDAADADVAARPRASSVRFVSGSCDPPPTLLNRRHLQQQPLHQQLDLDPQQQLLQQRRRSCGATDMSTARHPAAAQQRPSSDAVSAVLAPAASAQPLCGSPRRNVLCSPSRRFMLAAMIDMSPVEAEQMEQQQQQEGQEGSGRCQGEPLQEGGSLLNQQLPQGALASWGGGDATSATQGSCGAGSAGAGGGGGGGVPPATPQAQGGGAQAASSLPPATPAQNSCGGSAAASCAAARAAKLLSNRVSVGSGTSFFRWLDNGPGLDVDLAHLGVPRAKLDAERVKYLAPNELLEYELDVEMETGLLRYKRSGKLLHTGPDGRGSLDEHRRPPTPPPPAVPLALLGESAAAWWRGSSAAAAEPPPPPVPLPSCSQAVGVAAAAAPAPPLPPRNPSMGARQALRRIAPMGTVPEGFGGDGSSGDSPESPEQLVRSVDGAIEATAAAIMPGAASALGEGPHGSCTALVDLDKAGAGGGAGTVAAAAASLLPNLELRGHSASSLARLERSGDACYSAAEEGLGVVVPGGASSSSAAGSGCGSRSGSGDGDGSTRPCSSTEGGLAVAEASACAAATVAATAALSVSAAEAGSGGGGFAPHLAASLAPEARHVSSSATAEPVGYEDLAAAAKRAAVALRNQPEAAAAAAAAALLLPGVRVPAMRITTTSREAAPATSGGGNGEGMSTPTAAAVAAGGGAFASLIGGGLGAGPAAAPDAAGSSMPRTPVAAPPAGGGGGGGGVHGGGGGYHHEEKVTKWIYVVDPELRLFVHPKVRGRFHHSSFLRGGAVVAAGGLAARHGRLRLLTADSGHYWPREENFRWLCEHLLYVGADLSACELKSKHMPVPAATGKELMEKMGVPPPWRLSYVPVSSPSGPPAAAGADVPLSPLAEHMHLLQLQDVEADAAGSGPDAEAGAGAVPPAAEAAAKRG